MKIIGKIQSVFDDFLGWNHSGERIQKIDKCYGYGWNGYFIPFKTEYNEDITNGTQALKLIRSWSRDAKNQAIELYDWIAANKDNFEWYYNPEEFNDYDTHYARYFIGTVFSIYPSGKYYMPWANSNVSLIEACKDSIFHETLQEKLEKMDLWLESGEGDPCDLFVCKEIENNDNMA